jgi:organic hydroperoxide reductase OsmC/OhrA
MKKSTLHQYTTTVRWTGNTGEGTVDYQSYSRDYLVSATHKLDLLGSSDPAFRGDPTRYNPEDLLVASLAACHMLWYLHLCAVEGIVVLDYEDSATGVLLEAESGAGHFKEVVLHPMVTVAAASMIEKAVALHQKAREYCFIANSVNFPIRHEPVIRVV